MLNREVYTYCENLWVHGNIFIQLYTLQIMTIITGTYIVYKSFLQNNVTGYTKGMLHTLLFIQI